VLAESRSWAAYLVEKGGIVAKKRIGIEPMKKITHSLPAAREP
jgi:hypothetical protein